MLDALFAGRRRPQCAPAVTSTPTTSPYSSEQLMGMYSRESLTPADGVYLPSRSSYTPGEARKSLLAYIDSDNYAYADAERVRPKSIVLRREGPGEQVVATGTTVEAARAPDRNRTAKPRKSESKPGFLASVWALGFKREKRSYAASVGSSANGDDFIVDDEEGGLSESENERAALDKGKSREEVEEDLAGPSNRSYRSYSSSIITELDTVILTKEDLDAAANPELDGMPPVDDRPALERHQSKSQSELRPDPEEDIENMLRDAVNAAEALKAAPGPVIVDELPASEEAKVQEPAIESETTEVPPETPPKSPLRQRSPSVSSVGGLAKASKEEEGEPKAEAAIAEVADKAAESAEVKAEEAPSTDLQDYSKAMTDRILNPSPPNASQDVPESPAVTEPVTLPPVTEVVPEEEAAKPVPVSKASSRIEIDSEYAASSATAKPSSKIEIDSQYAASSTMAKPSSKIEVDSQYAASTATSKPEAGPAPVETKFTEGSSEETPKKAASITGTKPGLERRLSNAFRRDSVRRSLSVFSKKDKKDKNTPEWPSPATVIAAELTPPPTPPMTEDQVSIIERPKSRMSIFSLTKKDKKKKAASADADADSSDAAKSSTESAATPAPAPKPALQKKPSFISVADSYKSSRPGTSQGPLSPVKEGDSEIPKPPQRRPTFRRPFSSDGDRKSRTQSWFANRKLKFNEKGEPVDPGNDEEGISTPTSPVVDSIQPTPRGSNEVPATPAKEDKAKFFRRQSISLSKKPTFGLARDRSMSASAVTVNSAATAPAGPQAPSPTSSDAAETPTKVKGAARLKGLVRSNTFMSTFGKKKEKEKSKGKGKEVATE